jgi:DNA-binding response OmpR family regulator
VEESLMSDVLGRILIVDDEPAILELLTAFFSDGRFEVITAQHGGDALMIAHARRPDAVLLDILMPGMGGLTVLSLIRTMDASIPVVMLTGADDDKAAKDTATMGAFDYVTKPFDHDALYAIIVAAVTAGAGRIWSAFGADRVTNPAHRVGHMS